MFFTARSRRFEAFLRALLFLALPAATATLAVAVLPAGEELKGSAVPHAPDSLVYFGTFSRGPEGGIFVARLNSTAGTLSTASLAAQGESPGFLAVDATSERLYAVEEMTQGKATVGVVTGFEINRTTGQLRLKNRQTTDGGSFCYLALDRTQHFLGAARYNDGNAVILPLSREGLVQPVSSSVQHHGTGPNKERQEKAHVHSINFDPSNRFAFVADLGTDQIRSYRFDASAGKLTPNDPAFVQAPAGAGPRHFTFHPSGKFAYAVCEMSAAVVAYNYDADHGTLSQIQVAPLLTDDLPGERRAAEVVVDRAGKFLYVSNRGYDALVVFAIDPSTGQLTFVQREHEGIAYPRNFAIDPTGHWLLCANRDTNRVTVYAIDGETGKIKRTEASTQVPQPVCVRFLPLE